MRSLHVCCGSAAGPGKVLKLSFNYPTSVDRNIDEIVRCVSALQMCAKYPAATSTNSEFH